MSVRGGHVSREVPHVIFVTKKDLGKVDGPFNVLRLLKARVEPTSFTAKETSPPVTAPRGHNVLHRRHGPHTRPTRSGGSSGVETSSDFSGGVSEDWLQRAFTPTTPQTLDFPSSTVEFCSSR